VALLELWVGQTIIDLGARVDAASDLDGRLGEVWRGLIRHDDESEGAWLLLEFELWLHAARDPELGVVGASRLEAMRNGLAIGISQWSAELGFPLPAPASELSVQVIALLLGAAFQYRLEPATVPQEVVLDGLRRLLGLPPDDPSDTALNPTSRGATP